MTRTLKIETAEPLEKHVDRIYRNRFPQKVQDRRSAVWRILCRSWFSRYIPAGARVLEVAAGYCEFINNIPASKKVAVDLNPETQLHAAGDVIVHQIAAERLGEVVPQDDFDTAFMSNFLEHCRTREQVLAVLSAVHDALKPGGCVLILGPNFRCCPREYYDFFDHHLALTDKSVAEALELTGFDVAVVQPQTLPFTFRSRLPSWPWLVWLYLQLPLLWRFFGAQFFLVGRKSADPDRSRESSTPRANAPLTLGSGRSA
jgi:SAM-dependent methyltransferase